MRKIFALCVLCQFSSFSLGSMQPFFIIFFFCFFWEYASTLVSWRGAEPKLLFTHYANCLLISQCTKCSRKCLWRQAHKKLPDSGYKLENKANFECNIFLIKYSALSLFSLPWGAEAAGSASGKLVTLSIFACQEVSEKCLMYNGWRYIV